MQSLTRWEQSSRDLNDADGVLLEWATSSHLSGMAPSQLAGFPKVVEPSLWMKGETPVAPQLQKISGNTLWESHMTTTVKVSTNFVWQPPQRGV